MYCRSLPQLICVFTMKIHFAEVSPDRGQYGLLLNEMCSFSLFSYAYKNSKQTVTAFETYWNALFDLSKMYLHLTETTAKLGGNINIKSLLPQEGKAEHLFSYAYLQQARKSVV